MSLTSVSQQRFPANHSAYSEDAMLRLSVSQQRFPANHSYGKKALRNATVYLSSDSRQTIAAPHAEHQIRQVYLSSDSRQTIAALISGSMRAIVYLSSDSRQTIALF